MQNVPVIRISGSGELDSNTFQNTVSGSPGLELGKSKELDPRDYRDRSRSPNTKRRKVTTSPSGLRRTKVKDEDTIKKINLESRKAEIEDLTKNLKKHLASTGRSLEVPKALFYEETEKTSGDGKPKKKKISGNFSSAKDANESFAKKFTDARDTFYEKIGHPVDIARQIAAVNFVIVTRLLFIAVALILAAEAEEPQTVEELLTTFREFISLVQQLGFLHSN